MARTKQTARKSAGGQAPRRQLATTSARGLRTFLTGQQRVGNAVRCRGAGGAPSAPPAATSFLNHENVLGSFVFPRSAASNEFEAHFDAAAVPNQLTGLEETWLSVQFASKYDGDGIERFDRPPLALSLVLDISGSMSWCLQGDDDESDEQGGDGPKMSKLEAAKQCVAAILEQLTPVDECSMTLFNHEVQQLSPPRRCSPTAKDAILRELARVNPCGGTNLTRGFVAGMRVLEDGPAPRSSKSTDRPKLRRTIFLTDMESGPNDEEGVLQEARNRANEGMHTTVVGVGVDLSVGSVERLSSVPGCKYASVSNAAEFAKSIGAEFSYDVLPIAFDVRVGIGRGWAFERACGFAELNDLRPGAKEIAVSSEFASPLNGDGEACGGVLLLRLRRPPADARRSSPRLAAAAAEAKLELETTWKTPGGKTQTATTVVPLRPEPTATLRKGVALVRFCDLQTSFCEADEDAESLEARMRRLDACRAGRECLVSELRAVGDRTLAGANANILQTLDQIIRFEERELKGMRAEAEKRRSQKRRRSASPLASAGAHDNDNNEIPAHFLCPITKRRMMDPVSTTDGHTFERAAITRWFRGHATSPLTGLPLASKVLTPNHSLLSIIRELS